MIRVEIEVQIERPAGTVFGFVADQTNAPRWQRGLTEVRRLTDGPPGVGTEHAFVRTFAGRGMESRNRYTEFNPDHFVEFEIPDGWMGGTASYRVEPTESGSCHLIARMDFHVRGPLAVAEPLLTRLLARDARANVAALKRLLESTPSP